MLGVAVCLRGTAEYVVLEGYVPQYHRRLQMLYCQTAIRSRVLRELRVLYFNFAGVQQSSSLLLCKTGGMSVREGRRGISSRDSGTSMRLCTLSTAFVFE